MKRMNKAVNPITLWNPFDMVTDFSPLWGRPFMSLADRFFTYNRETGELKISEDDKNFTVRTDIPGFRKEEVKVRSEKGMLVVSGHHRHESRTRDGYERDYSAFSRSITLPRNADASHRSTMFGNGVLEVCMPKRKAHTGGRRHGN